MTNQAEGQSSVGSKVCGISTGEIIHENGRRSLCMRCPHMADGSCPHKPIIGEELDATKADYQTRRAEFYRLAEIVRQKCQPGPVRDR